MMNKKKILERILEPFNGYPVIKTAGQLSWRDLTTLLLPIMEKKVAKLTPLDVIKNYENNRLCQPANTGQRDLLEIDSLIYKILPDRFEDIELSPVSAIGSNCALTKISPKVVLETIRSVEVNADPTTALALECARKRRQQNDIEEIHLATSHRSLRLQLFTDKSGFKPHFRSFCLASSGKNYGRENFAAVSLAAHLEIWIRFLQNSRRLGYAPKEITVAVSNINIIEQLAAQGSVEKKELMRRTQDPDFHPFEQYGIDLPEITEKLPMPTSSKSKIGHELKRLKLLEEKEIETMRLAYPDIRFQYNLARCAGIGYYRGLCFKITAKNSGGATYPLVDGGASDWMKKLLCNQRERLFVSGLGTQLYADLF